MHVITSQNLISLIMSFTFFSYKYLFSKNDWKTTNTKDNGSNDGTVISETKVSLWT